MKIWRSLFTLIMVFSLSANSFAAEKAKKKTIQSGQASSAATKENSQLLDEISSKSGGYSGAALDLNASKLPRRYAGNDFVKVYRACKNNASRFVKTGFENNQQFEKRRESLLASPLLGKLMYGDKLAFSKKFMDGDYTASLIIDNFTARNANEKSLYDRMKAGLQEVENRTALTYDAEEETVKITFGVPILLDSIKKSSYKGTNAYGATVHVQKVEGAINFIKCLPESCAELSLTTKMPGETAQRLSQSGRILIIGKVKEPFFEAAPMPLSIEPTFESPLEVSITLEGLMFDVFEIWLYDFETGEIFVKHKVENSEMQGDSDSSTISGQSDTD
ncbi:MAG: hypothetical protein HZA03_03600 [Nitrospinae bacterium]|nr:hypothetical protein [Nitrospinota bacterium]